MPSSNYLISVELEGWAREKEKKKERNRKKERERERGRERRENAECIANVPRVPILKTTPEGIQKPRERGESRFPGGSVSQQGDRDRAREKGEGHGNYFRTVKPARREGDASRHPESQGLPSRIILKLY